MAIHNEFAPARLCGWHLLPLNGTRCRICDREWERGPIDYFIRKAAETRKPETCSTHKVELVDGYCEECSDLDARLSMEDER